MIFSDIDLKPSLAWEARLSQIVAESQILMTTDVFTLATTRTTGLSKRQMMQQVKYHPLKLSHGFDLQLRPQEPVSKQVEDI